MDTSYKPKHKKPEGWAGSTPRGPARWFRAADVAMRKPNTKGGRMFWERASRALTVAQIWGDLADGPFAHIHEVRKWNHVTHNWSRIERKIRYYTCSMFCCTMVTQLDTGITTVDGLVDYFSENEWAPIDSVSPLRVARCQFCATKIKAK